MFACGDQPPVAGVVRLTEAGARAFRAVRLCTGEAPRRHPCGMCRDELTSVGNRQVTGRIRTHGPPQGADPTGLHTDGKVGSVTVKPAWSTHFEPARVFHSMRPAATGRFHHQAGIWRQWNTDPDFSLVVTWRPSPSHRTLSTDGRVGNEVIGLRRQVPWSSAVAPRYGRAPRALAHISSKPACAQSPGSGFGYPRRMASRMSCRTPSQSFETTDGRPSDRSMKGGAIPGASLPLGSICVIPPEP